MTLRSAQVAAAKAAGDKELAKQIGQLRKPTRSAWLVNLLARDAGADLDGLLEIGAALREAQENRDGAELRRLSTERHRAVEALTRRAAELGAAAEYAATEAVRQEVSSDPAGGAGRSRPRRCGASRHAEPGGQLRRVRSLRDDRARAARAEADPGRSGRRAATRATRRIRSRRPPNEQSRKPGTAGGRLASNWPTRKRRPSGSPAAADELADRVDELRTQLAAAEEAEAEARRTARTARKQVDEMSAAERSARAAAEEAGVDTTG